MDKSVASGTSINYFEKYQVKIDNLMDPLGNGVFGIVYKGSFPGTDEKIAMKVARKNEHGIPATTLREVSLLESFEHANIVRLLKVEQDEKNVYSILEYLDHTLTDYIKKKRIDLQKIKIFMHHLLSAAEYLHGRNVMHRDLKPDNLMINADGNLLKVIDFGLARLLSVGSQSVTPDRQPLWYRAPEVLMGLKNYSCAVDIWSIGCVFGEMINGETPPFVPEEEESQITCIFRKLGTPTEQSWPGVTSLPNFPKGNSFFQTQGWAELHGRIDKEGLDLLSKLLVLNPKGRISASDALKHPYFEERGDE